MSTGVHDNTRRPIPWVLLIVLLLIGAFLAFFLRIEWEEREIDLGFTQEARRNPWLAAGQLLHRLGIPSAAEPRLQRTQALPPTDQTLIVTTARYSLGAQRSEALLDWVRQGGHLIVTAHQFYDPQRQGSGDRLLDALPVHLYETVAPSEDCPETCEKDGANAAGQTGEDNAEPASELPQTVAELLDEFQPGSASYCTETALFTPVPVQGEASLDVVFHGQRALDIEQADVALWAADNRGVQFAQLHLGAGQLSVLTDLSLWNNYRLACFDHAYFLWRLVRGSDKVWFLYNERMPGLLVLWWRHGAPVLIALVSLVLLWAWSQTLRYGPLTAGGRPERRDFSEHISAATRFLWRHRGAGDSIDTLRRELRQRLEYHHPNFQQLPREQQLDIVHAISRIDPPALDQALFDTPPADEKAALAVVQTLQQIRKTL